MDRIHIETVEVLRLMSYATTQDSLYLSYGSEDVHLVAKQSDEDTFRQYLADLTTVGAAYLVMASTFVGKRVVETSWDSFLADLDINSRFSTHRL